jgi:hypothetical protein
VTDDPARFATLANRFLGMDVDAPTLVEPDRLGEAIRLNEAQLRNTPIRKAV